MIKIIRDWNELVGLESETHYLEINVESGYGHIRNKDKTTEHEFNYLSTHTFYGGRSESYKGSTLMLRKKGFNNIIIDNWDNPFTDDLDKEEYIRQIEQEAIEYDEKVRLKNEREELRQNMFMSRGLFESKDNQKLRLEREIEWNRTHLQGRNELCNCLSGKKFKNCCGGREN